MDMTPVMRFQVANDSINLVKNPNGERGAWFYDTPVTNTLLTSTDIRTNLVTNPSMEVNTTGWTGVSTTIARTTSVANFGTAALQLTRLASNYNFAYTTVNVTAGTVYTVSAYFRSAATSRNAFTVVEWRDASNAIISDTWSLPRTSVTTSTTEWKRASQTVTAPVGAVTARVYTYIYNANTAGEVHYLDAVMFEASDTINTYFDGSTGGTWSGTAHASTSTIEAQATGTGDKLTFKTTVSQSAYFRSNKLAVTAGEYLSSRIDLIAITASHNIKIRYNWYNSSDVLLSSSVLSGALSTIGTNIGPTIVAPASTAWARLIVYIENGSTNALANAYATFNKVMVKKAPAGSTTSQRTNLVTNPNFATATTGWAADNTNTTIGRTTAKQYVGTGAGFVRRDSSVGWGIARTGNITISEKQTYTVSAYVSEYTGDAIANAKIGVEWFTTSGKSLGIKWGTTVNPGTGWTRLTMTGTAPGGATKAQVRVASYSSAAQRLVFDAVLFEKANAVDTYFDGATTDTAQITYDWTSTANASTSTATSTSTYFDYVDPWDWRDILGTTSNITIDRGGLDTGTLTASIIDPTLDPVDSEILAEGKTVRLQVLKDNGVWVNRFEGQIDSLKTNYPAVLKAFADVTTKTIIELTAIDNTSNLAGHKYTDSNGKSVGVSVAHIPGIIEGASVPWLVNGLNSQVASITKLSVSDDASALDQIAIARDSERGYAFVNKDNVLVAVNSANIDNTVKATLTDTPVVNGVQDGTAWATSGWGIYNSYGFNVSNTAFSLQTGSGMDAYDAFYRCSLTAAGSLGFDITQTLHVPVREGDRYVLNGWVRYTNNTNNNVAALYALRKADNEGTYYATTSTNLLDGQWTQVRFELDEAPAGVETFDAMLRIASANSGDTLDVTGFFVEQVGNQLPSYRDAVVTSSTDDIVNSVTVNKLSNNANDTQPIAYTGYKDTDSIAKFGEVVGEYPYQGSTAGVAAFAQSILTAAAWPVRRLESLVFPVYRDTLSWDYGCDLDLYDVVHVKYADKIDLDHRITRITETFSVEADTHRWEIAFGFAAVSGVASPRTTGGTGKTTTKSNFGAVMQTNTQTMTSASTTSILWNTTVATNPEMTISSAGITVNQDGWYRVFGQVALDNVGTTGVMHIGVRVNGSTVCNLNRAAFASSAPTMLSGSAVLNLTAGDIVTLTVFQSNGANRTIYGTAPYNTTMELHPL